MRGVAWICVAGAWLAFWPGVAAGAGPLERLPPAVPSVAVAPQTPDRVLMRVRTGGAQAVAARHGGRVVRRLAPLGWVEVAPSGSARSLARSLDTDPAVAEVEVDHVREAYAHPDDLLYARGINQRPYLNLTRFPQAWDVTTGSDAVVTAVLDTGVDLDHPDLAPRLVPGVDAVDGDGVPADENGHGTAVAGALGAATGNGEGIAGATWRGGVMPVRVLGADGTGSDADIAAGIVAAVDRGARILNLSLGGPEDGALLRDAIAYAVDRGALVVAAAGNEASDEPSYPAAYPGVLAVAATDWEGDTFWLTSRGDWVDIAAPGSSIAVTRWAAGPIHAYAAADGTSFSAPLVAGVAAQVLARNPGFSPDQVKGALMVSAQYLPSHDPGAGVGELNASGAVAVGSPPNPNANLYQFVTDGSFDAEAWVDHVRTNSNWTASNWTASNWTASNWTASNWVASNWTASNWTASNWTASNWTASNWTVSSDQE
jgi:serine protease